MSTIKVTPKTDEQLARELLRAARRTVYDEPSDMSAIVLGIQALTHAMLAVREEIVELRNTLENRP